MKFVDIHTHIAYDLDDGAKTLQESIDIFKQAYEQGYESIVMTPHINMNGDYQYTNLIKERYHELKDIALSYGIDLYIGNEIMLDDKTLEHIENKTCYSLNNSRYILLECDHNTTYYHKFNKLEEYLNIFLNQGYKPVIAHIERYFQDDIDLDYIEYLIQKGCLIQVNTNSIIDKNYYKKVKPLLEHHLVHIISTDVHSCEGKRVINMKQAYDYLKKAAYDNQYIEDIMYNHGYMIIHNKDIEIKEYKKRTLFSRLKNA